MAKFFEPSECDPGIVQCLKVAVIGYGNQGHAHALNLRDSGVSVIVGARAGSESGTRAQTAGFDVRPVADCAREADLLMLTLPDVPMSQVYRQDIEPHLRPGQALLFAHGFNVHYKLIQAPPEVHIGMVSPKGPGHGLRSEYLQGRGLAALVAVDQDAPQAPFQALELCLSYAAGIGAHRALIMETTFREETECDLFGEQAVLCGGLIELVKAGFETLVEAGYEPEAAYFECVHETKLIVDLLISRGFRGMREAISDTAEWGGYGVGPRVVGDAARAEMRAILHEIQNGAFTRTWLAESEQGAPNLHASREQEAGHPAEAAGAEIRSRLPFLRDLLRE
jgi:ketol-acid reductoisomerase